MFKALFLATLFITLVVNIIFLITTKDKPPDPSTSTLVSVTQQIRTSDDSSSISQRRLFLRSNDFYDYSAPATAGPYSSPLSTRNSPQNSSQVEAKLTTITTTNYATIGSVERETTNQNRSINQDESAISASGSIVRASVISDRVDHISSNSNSETQRETERSDYRDQITMEPASHLVNTTLMQKLRTYDHHSNDIEIDLSDYKLHNKSLQHQQQKLVHKNSNVLRSGTDQYIAEIHSPRRLSIRVKSSKNHVFISVDNIIVYESKVRPQWGIREGNGNIYKGNNDDQLLSLAWRSQSAQTTNALGSGRSGGTSISDDSDVNEARGIHVLVLNQYDGHVMSKRVFDTYSQGQDEELCFFLNTIRDGRIIIFSIKDEGTFKMPANSPARVLLQRLGSRRIMELKWRDMWAFVVRKSSLSETDNRLGEPIELRINENALRNNLAEGSTKSVRFTDWGTPLVLETSVELVEPKFRVSDNLGYDCIWTNGNKEENKRREDFCSRVEGYGRVCDCNSPAPISFNSTELENSQLTHVPIIVIASNRPYYLYRMLRSLLTVTGIDPSMVTVFIDGFYEEPLMVSRLFNLRAIQQRPLAQRSARISHHYKSSLTATFELFPRAEFAIIFEEDLDIASDALIYFNQTLELLQKDPTLYCVSAWNDQGYEHSARDPKLIYRIETMPGLGWMLSRRLYKEELELNWPSASQPHDWDMWIRTHSVRKGRECLIPDISRTFHFGSTGTNINSYFQHQYFSKHAFNMMPQKEFANLNQLTSDAYELVIARLVSDAHVIQTAPKNNSTTMTTTNNSHKEDEEYLCSLATNEPHNSASSLNLSEATKLRLGLLPTTSSTALNETTYNVIYIRMIDNGDYKNWLKLAKCWRIWDLDARGQHKSMWRLFLGGKPVMVVGVPASPYSRFKPAHVVPFNSTA